MALANKNAADDDVVIFSLKNTKWENLYMDWNIWMGHKVKENELTKAIIPKSKVYQYIKIDTNRELNDIYRGTTSIKRGWISDPRPLSEGYVQLIKNPRTDKVYMAIKAHLTFHGKFEDETKVMIGCCVDSQLFHRAMASPSTGNEPPIVLDLEIVNFLTW